MTDLAKLVVKLEAQTAQFQKRLDDADKKTKKFSKNTSKNISGIKASFSSLAAGAAIAVIAAAAISSQMTTTIAKFQKYDANLKTATGSTENAAIAMQALQDFAGSTPFALEQSIQAFVKLKNLGLDPSESAMRSYGNTAVALGKDLNQMIEAVADASTLEFERLKEFGIKAKQSADSVAFTFQGTTTKVGKNAEEITNYLQNIGNENFAGAMDEQFNSLNGLMSNFGDNIDKLVVGIGNSGFTDIITKGFELANSVLGELNATLESGELGAKIEAIAGRFDGFASDFAASFEIANEIIVDSFDIVSKISTGFMEMLPAEAASALSGVTTAFSNLPENVRAFLQIIVTEFAATFDGMIANATFYKDAIKAVFTDDTIEEAHARLEKQRAIISSARLQSIDAILAEKEASLNSFDQQIVKAEDLRKVYEEAKAARAEQSKSGGVLGQFKIKTETGSDDSALADAAKRAEQIIKETTPKIDSIRAKVEETAALFSKNLLTPEQFDQANTLYTEQIAELAEKDTIAFEDKLVRLEEQFATEIEYLELQKNERLRLLDDENVFKIRSEEELARIRLQINDRYNKDKIDLDRDAANAQIDSAQYAAQSVIGILGAFATKSFKAQKVLAIAESIVNIVAGVAKALNNPYPANLGFAAQVAAEGAALISTIKSTNPKSSATSVNVSGGASSAGNYATPDAVSEVRSQKEIEEENQKQRKVEMSLLVDDFTESPMRKFAEKLQDTASDMGIEFSIKNAA